ncbi:MAG: DNA methyltransferase, partial [Nitrososphaera sp.]
MERLYKEGRIVQTKPGNVPRYKRYLDEMKGVELQDIWIDINPVSTSKESIGYPTQKPEALLERLINLATNEGDIVADFFCGGGVTPLISQKLGRRWIACDQSRVAVAITQARVEASHEDGSIQTKLAPRADVSVEYWGTYEIPSLVQLSEDEFRSFIVSAYGGRISTTGGFIHGFKREVPLFVGPASQEKQVVKEDVLNFAKEITTKKGKRQGIMLAWAFAPSAKIAVEKLMAEGSAVDLIQISPIEIESSQFREHITKLHNEYESFLKFILPPEVRLVSKRIAPSTYSFDVSESVALNEGAKIINVQWDFEFKGRFTPTRGFAFGRDSRGNPLYKVEYKFERIGRVTVACR